METLRSNLEDSYDISKTIHILAEAEINIIEQHFQADKDSLTTLIHK